MARLRRFALIAVTFTAFLAGTVTADSLVETRYLQGLGDTRYNEVESSVIGRSFHIFVNLPDGYDESTDTKYPTIYLLDGGSLFPLLAAYHGYLGLGDETPDVILVGISYGASTFKGGNYRSTDFTAPSAERDFWGGAGKFQQFLSNELFPYVEGNFQSRADRRVIFGHSLGGQFVLYTALTKPNLFWGHIASNPALHRNLPFFLEHRAAESGASKLFVASGSLDDPVFRAPALEWIERWSDRDDKPWQLETLTLEGHTHVSAPPASFRAGMTWLFSEPASPSDEEVLRHFKTVLWPRAYRTQDVELLDSLLHDSFEVIDADGKRSSKQQELDFIRDNKWDPGEFEYRIERLDIYDGSVAIISGTGIAETYTYTSSNVLIKEDGRWRAIASHVSGVASTEASAVD